jgi:hypothetical protein
MADNPKQKASANEVDTLVGQAWSEHYHGKNDNAIQSFQGIVQRWPEHIDANFGLSLALKTAGRKAEAVEAFTRTKALVAAALETENQGDENSRMQMLARIVDQHLSTLR